ncbi:MAG: polysaccharide biosynthesis protein, partial [Armatimonadota bacterium]
GEPVKIVDLAKDMISLYGMNPDVDIEISYTGIRPGEKLHEQLATESSEVAQTPWDKLSIVYRPRQYDADMVHDMVKQAAHIIKTGDELEIAEFLNETVPGFVDREQKAWVQSLIR